MFKHLFPKEHFDFLKNDYSLHTMFLLCKYMRKNDIYVHDDTLYINGNKYNPLDLKHYISKWIFESIDILSKQEQKDLLSENTFYDLFDFIFEHNEGFVLEFQQNNNKINMDDEEENMTELLIEELSKS